MASWFLKPAPKRARRDKLRIGFVCGKEDGDLVAAPGLPERYRCADAEAPRKKKDRGPEAHSDVAIWWWVKTHYSESVEADLIRAPGEVTAERLAANDVNLLLGWDAVSAHLEEADGTGRFEPGHGEGLAALLRDPASRVFPPAELQDLVNAKGDYILKCIDAGVPAAPTAVYDCAAPGAGAADFARFAAREAQARGWKKFIAKPSPSSWSRGVDAFRTQSAAENPRRLEKYFRDRAGAKAILLQRHLAGLAAAPETRCFFFGGEFLYAVANSTHPRGGRKLELESCPESASSRDLPAKYWRPHAALARDVVERVLPELRGLAGQPLGCRVPWLVRVDVGLHAAGDLENGCAEDAPEKRRREKACFVNEIEIVPTLYLAAKFGHRTDYLAHYARGFVRTAFDACGRECPPPDAPEPPARPATPLQSDHLTNLEGRT